MYTVWLLLHKCMISKNGAVLQLRQQASGVVLVMRNGVLHHQKQLAYIAGWCGSWYELLRLHSSECPCCQSCTPAMTSPGCVEDSLAAAEQQQQTTLLVSSYCWLQESVALRMNQISRAMTIVCSMAVLQLLGQAGFRVLWGSQHVVDRFSCL